MKFFHNVIAVVCLLSTTAATASSDPDKEEAIRSSRGLRRRLDKLSAEIHLVDKNQEGRELTTTTKVITLGDSYSSGTGIHRNDGDYDEPGGGNPSYNGVSYKLTVRSDNECWREKHTTPGPKLAATNNQADSIFLACKGAEVSHVSNQFDYLNALYPSDTQNNWSGSTILVTAGGNDIRTGDGKDWPELLEHCITYRFFLGDCTKKSYNNIVNFATVETRLTNLYKDIASQASQAVIRVLGYPKLMQRDPGCGSVTGIERDEADWMDDRVIDLNNRVQAAVTAAQAAYPNVDIEFVNVYNYLTVGACGDGANNRHVHDKRLTSWGGTSDSSFHPSQLAYDAYYSALLNSL